MIFVQNESVNNQVFVIEGSFIFPLVSPVVDSIGSDGFDFLSED